MARGEIKTKLVLEGEAEYKRQMTDVANAIKVLDSEQKLAEAQFKATGDAQQYAADKARILKDKMAEQQKAVDAAQAAVDKLKKKGIDPNSKAMQTWNTRLNTAKTRLVNMQTELDRNETELNKQQEAVEGVSGAFDGLGDTAEDIDSRIKLEQAIQAVDSMRQKLADALTAAKDFAVWLYNSETSAGKWADDLATAASRAGVDPETYQSWMYASQFIDTEVSAIISSREKLTQKLTSSSKEDAKSFNALGVATRESNGDVRDATAVFWDCIDALGRIKDPTERAAKAQDIFGTSWRDLQPLIETGSKAYNSLAEEGRQVAVVSQENVDKLAALDDSHNRVTSAMNKTERTLQAKLAPAFTKLNDPVTNALTRFNEWAETPEGQQALEKLGDAAVSLVDSLTTKDFEGMVDKATSAVESLTGALDWISEHGEVVTGILLGMGGAWAGLTVTKEVLEFVRLLRLVPWDKISASGSAGAVNAAKTAVSSAAKAAAPAVSGAAGSGLAATVAPVALVAGSSLALAAAISANASERDFGDYNRLNDSGGVAQAIQDAREGGKAAYADALEAFAEGLRQQEEGEGIDAIKQAAEQFSGLLDELMPDKGDTGRYDAFDWIKLATDATVALAQKVEEAKQAGNDTAEGYTEGINEGAADAATAAGDMAQGAVDAVETTLDSHSPSRVMEAIGENVSIGLANGINARAQDAINAANALAQAVTATLRSAMQIASPSKVMATLGGYVAQGFAQGMEDQISAVERATNRMVATTTRVPVSSRQPAAAGRGAGNGDINAYIVMDKQVVGQLVAPAVDGYIGAQMQTRR